MRLLLDTHALLWWMYGDERLSATAHKAILDQGNAIFVSSASAWEISTKFRIGKLPHAGIAAENLIHYLKTQGFIELPITMLHAQCAGLLPGTHKDPFDRMLIAQAMLEKLTIVTNEVLFDRYDIHRFW
ncbi:MAG: type II toxin-antitoxin system VapC family toxin [Magnetococcus sp. DMHC-1]